MQCFLVELNLISFLLTSVLNDCLTKAVLSCSATSDTDDIRYKVKRCLENVKPFSFKKCKDFCLLNLIKHIKYNLCLWFIHRIGPF